MSSLTSTAAGRRRRLPSPALHVPPSIPTPTSPAPASPSPSSARRAAPDAIPHAPAVDVRLYADRFVARLDVPGVVPADLAIELSGGCLVVDGLRALPRDDGAEGGWAECPYGRVRRVIPLPAGATTGLPAARLSAGVLEVVVPIEAPRLAPRRRGPGG